MRESAEPKVGRSDPPHDGEDVPAGLWCESRSARAIIGSAIGAAVDQLRVQLPSARSGEDPEGVHQARVASRRLRSDLRTFAPLLDDPWRRRTRAELQRVADALGTVRDNDVLRMRIERGIVDVDLASADAGPLLDRLREEGRVARRELAAEIDDERTATLLAGLARDALDPPTTPSALGRADRRLPPLVRAPWRKLLRSVESLGDRPDVQDLHRIRLLAKRVRYAAEAVAPVCGADARRFAAAVQEVQDVLGELHDAEVAVAWLEGIGRDVDPPAAFAAGRLAEHFRAIAASHHHGWERSLRRAQKRSAWLT